MGSKHLLYEELLLQPACAALMKCLCRFFSKITATLQWAGSYHQLLFYSMGRHRNANMNLGFQGLEMMFLVQESGVRRKETCLC